MLAYLITGKTYPNRRALRAAGGVWSGEDRGYLLPAEHLSSTARLIDSGELSAAEIEAKDDAFAPLEGEASAPFPETLPCPARNARLPRPPTTGAPHHRLLLHCSGQIGIGGGPCPSGALPVTRDRSKRRLREIVEGAVRHACGNHSLLVHGVPEAESAAAALSAVEQFCARIAARL